MPTKTKLTDEKIELAMMMIAAGSKAPSVAQAIGVGEHHLLDRIRWYKKTNGMYQDGRLAHTQQPLERQPKDTRSFSDRLHGNPMPGRSALDRLRAQQPDRWQMMDISAIPTSCINRQAENG